MAMETDVILKQIYLQAKMAKDTGSFDSYLVNLKAIVGEENVAVVDKMYSESKKQAES